MVATSHIGMHQEHARWRAENNSWRDDLAMWQNEIDQAIDQLPELEKALRLHAEMMKRHAAAIRLYEQDPATHEHLLADYERGESPEALVEFARSHQREADEHLQQRESHEGHKNKHHRLMAKWRQLFRALAHVKPTSPSTSPK